MEVKREVDDSKEVENEQANLEEDRERKLPTWMLTSDETLTTQNDESAKCPPPDEDKEETTEAAATTSVNGTSEKNKRISCKYGESCYRRNPEHKEEFSHPGDDDYTIYQQNEESPQNDDSKPECQYGTSCYRQNPQHKRDFKHTQPPCVETPEDSPKKKNTRRPAKRSRRSSDYESEGDKDYDLEDSFIDDTEDEEENTEEEDEDYVPDNNDQVDPELLKEDEWKASSDDAPEVLELLKEARDYLRNKKLQK